jgi:DNA polymerase III delta prime subunit
MSWYEKYSPKHLDDILSNKNVVGYLKQMIKINNFSHFILSGDSGSGKRTLIKVFLNSVTKKSNTLWINHLSLKTLDAKDKLNSFINSKTNETHKWLIIENLHKMSSQFLYVLYNILSSRSIVVCVLESHQQVDLSSWAMTFKMNSPNESTFIDIAKMILKKEKIRFPRKIVQKCINNSNNKLRSFLFFLQINCQKKCDLSCFSNLSFSYDNILFNSCLKIRIKELLNLEKLGFSHQDIAMELFRYVTNKVTDINHAIIIGETIEHLSHYEHDLYHLYACICKIWKNQKQNNVLKIQHS